MNRTLPVKRRDLCHFVFAFGIALWLILSCHGCSSDVERAAKHMQRAEAYVAEQKYDEAVIEYKNVTLLQPEQDIAYFQLAETYAKLNKIDLAAQTYAETIKRNPDHVAAHLKLGRILVAAGKTLGARKAAKGILSKNPKHIEALQLFAAVKVQEGNRPGAIETLQEVVAIAPEDQQNLYFLAQLQAAEGRMGPAEQNYLRLIEIDPTDAQAFIKLARLYGDQGKWKEALAVLDRMGPKIEYKYRYLSEFARFCEGKKKWALAEKLYVQSVQSAPENEAGALFRLGQYYARRGAHQKALETIQKANSIRSDDAEIWATIGSLQLDLQQIDAAERAADRAIALNSEHALANFTKGRILLIKKDFTPALHRFEQTIRKSPKNADAHYYKGLCIIGGGISGLSGAESDLFRAAAGLLDDEQAWVSKLAKDYMTQAVDLDPRHLKARVVLAEIYLKENDTEHAREQIEAALALAPGLLKTRALQGSLLLMEGNAAGAEKLCKTVLARMPDSSDWHLRLGTVYQVMERPQAAFKSYQKALELDPMRLDALKPMLEILVRSKKAKQALKLCQQHKQQLSDQPKMVAVVENMTATIFLAMRDLEAAIAHFSAAMEKDANYIAPQMALGGIYARQGQPERATRMYNRVLEQDPRYIPAIMSLGTLNYLLGEKKAAEQYFRQVLKIKGNHGQAANNLAYLLSARDDKLAEAYKLAQLAEKELPKDSSAKDTIGWLYYRVGDYDQAIAKFKSAVALDPKNAMAQYHLGLAYYQTNRFEPARAQIKKALAIDPDFEEAQDARALLDD